MLDELHVRNLGLIAEAGLEPGPGLVVVTGETGTGKTLLLGALRLLAGEPARRERIGPSGDEILVEARFVFDETELTVARRVGAGRSRAYLDGAMVPARALAERTRGLVEIVGQHDHLRLAAGSGARLLLDGSLDEGGAAAAGRYRTRWAETTELRLRRDLIGGDRRALERELDVVRFQATEIAEAGFGPGEDVELERAVTRLRHAEELAAELATASTALGEDGAAGALETAIRALRAAARTDPSLGEVVGQAEEVAELLGELAGELARVGIDLERDPGTLAALEARVARLGDLRRKYGETLEEVLAFGEGAARRAEELETLLGQADRLEEELEAAEERLREAAADLREARQRAAQRLGAAAVDHLEELGFAAPVVRFRIEPTEPGPAGADRVSLEFASDEGLRPGPLARVASGGELSRLVLALRLAAGSSEVDVLAFDEIDAGVGGATALALGRKLAALARGRQVLCVTHLPQVAAFADRHIVVRRSGNTAVVHRVVGEERVEELSRMLAGLPESAKGREHAAELLELARQP